MKKVELEINGRIIRVSEHIVDTMASFGAVRKTYLKKDLPRELIKVPIELIKVAPEIIEPIEVKPKRGPKPKK